MSGAKPPATRRSPSEQAQLIALACQAEVLARKPGNVHPEAAFDDVDCFDFLRSAEACAPLLAQSAQRGIGETVLACVRATREVARSNTNLGMILLIAPLAAVPENQPLTEGIPSVLANTTITDAERVYEAIRIASPGGLGSVREQDVAAAPTKTLVEVMRKAEERDAVARQYAGGFADVLETGRTWLQTWLVATNDIETTLIGWSLQRLASHPDTLIARKCGDCVAVEASQRSEAVLDAGWPKTPAGRVSLQRFDEWLRADGNRRNPGTTADLLAACLYAALRDGLVPTQPFEKFVKLRSARSNVTR